MSSDNPNHVSGLLREQLGSQMERAFFNIGHTVVKSQGPIVESLASSTHDEIEAWTAILEGDPSTAPHLDKAALLLGITGAVVDRRADEFHQELTERALSHSYGGSE